MSRIAKNSIKLPQDTTCNFDNNTLRNEGQTEPTTMLDLLKYNVK